MKPSKQTVLYEADLKRLEEIKTFILNNLGQELNVPLLAVKFGMGKSTLRKHFVVLYQQPISDFITESRMQKALELLVNRTVPVTQIGINIGYSDASSFTHAFSKYFGRPPIYFLGREPKYR